MESRMLCFYYFLVLYNEWIIVRTMLSDDAEMQSAMVCRHLWYRWNHIWYTSPSLLPDVRFGAHFA